MNADGREDGCRDSLVLVAGFSEKVSCLKRIDRGAKGRLPLWSGHGFDHFLHSDDVDYSFEVVTQNRQAHLRAHLVQSSHQEVTVTHRPLDRAEGWLA